MKNEIDSCNSIYGIDRHKPSTQEWDMAENILQQKLSEDPNFSGKIRRSRDNPGMSDDVILKHSFVYISGKLLSMPLGARLGEGATAKVIKVQTRNGEKFALKQEEDLVTKYGALVRDNLNTDCYSRYLKKLKRAKNQRESEKSIMLKLGCLEGNMSRSSESLDTDKRKTTGDYYKYYSLQKLHEGKELFRIMTNWQLRIINLSDWQRLVIAIKCLEELRVLHKLGILHRDIKGENFIAEVNDNSNVDDIKINLVDFGFAVESPGLVFIEKERMGTRHYVAPEIMSYQVHESGFIYNHARYSDKSDIYALGIMFSTGLKLSTKIVESMYAREFEERPTIDTIKASLLLELYTIDENKAVQMLSTLPETIMSHIEKQDAEKYNQLQEKLIIFNEVNKSTSVPLLINSGVINSGELQTSNAMLCSFDIAMEKKYRVNSVIKNEEQEQNKNNTEMQWKKMKADL